MEKEIDIAARLDYINSTLAAFDMAWPRLAGEIQSRIDSLTLKLISANDDETRGAIKELRRLLVLPDTLASERDHIKLSQEDAT